MLTTPSHLVLQTTVAYKPILTKFNHGQIKWLLSFDISKCITLHFGHGNLQYQYTSKTSLIVLLPTFSSGRDLGVQLDDSLKSHEHTDQVVLKANANLGLLKRTMSI